MAEKRALSFVVVILLSSVLQAKAGLIGPVQWKVEDGGNNHWYALVFPEDNPDITWFEAETAAEDFSLFLGTGHLATITSAPEDDFLRDNFSAEFKPRIFGIQPGDNAWIGLTDRFSEGNFQWITGESFSYENFRFPEPNNLGNEDFVHVWFNDETGGLAAPIWSWNDSQPTRSATNRRVGFIVEGTTVVPEPSSMFLCGIGFVFLAVYRCFRRSQ